MEYIVLEFQGPIFYLLQRAGSLCSPLEGALSPILPLLGWENFWGQKNFWDRENFLGWEIFLGRENFSGRENYLGPKILKNQHPEIPTSKIILGFKNFAPPLK